MVVIQSIAHRSSRRGANPSCPVSTRLRTNGHGRWEQIFEQILDIYGFPERNARYKYRFTVALQQSVGRGMQNGVLYVLCVGHAMRCCDTTFRHGGTTKLFGV